MDGFDPTSSFGPDVAARYDDHLRGDEDAAADLLAGLAGDGRALELAIGTGRIAVPLMDRGVEVDGIEQSQAMTDRLLTKRPDTRVVIGDMARAAAPRSGYRLVFLVYNTIGNLLTQDDQVRCFENAARHLTGEGVFALECRVPTAPTRPDQRFIEVEQLELDQVELGVSRYDPVTQILDVNHVHLGVDGLVFSPIRLRLAYPPEFDLMAHIAGLRLRDRWGGWNDEPFTAASWRHVSVYEPADI
jgi:SAM-dependent methyltransferase